MSVRATDVRRAFIDGGPSEPAGEVFESVNPATGEVIAEVALSGPVEVDAAVASAAEAQRVWARMAPGQRGELLWAWGEAVVAAGDEVAATDVADMGKVISDAQAEMPAAGRLTRYWAGMADKLWGDQIPVTPGHLSYTVHEPLGVCGIVLPWNGPAIMFVSRVSTALAGGNAVVVKPSELSPLSALRLAELAVEAGLPPGLVNVVPGDGTTGEALVTHPGVAGVSFTGSVATGRRIAAAAAPSFKKLVLELGGKGPNIVFADADLDEAVRAAVWGVFQNAGQVCCAGTRLLVQRSIAGAFVDRLAALAAKVRVGDPMDPASQVGPVVSDRQLARVLDYIGAATADGGQVVAGGGAPSVVPHPGGYYVAPTVVANLDPGARVAREEVFGPVLSVLEFEDEAHAIELANDTEYGLSANVWTGDGSRMLRMAEALDTGVVWGNTSRLMDPALGFGGFKSSGVGHATGREAIEGVTRTKRVSLRYGTGTPLPAWPDAD